MKRVGSVKGFLAAAIAVAMFASSFDTAWTARATSFHANVDPSLSAGEVALVHTTAGRAGALSLKLAELGAVEIETYGAADTIVVRLSNQARAWIATDPNVTVATRDGVIALGGGGGSTGFEHPDKDGKDADKDKNDENNRQRRQSATAIASVSLMAIRAPQAWTSTTGEGATVAVMDTGIAAHPDLARGKVKARLDFVKDGSKLEDPGGHGTFIAGLIAASGGMKGVAPDADLVSLRVLDANGNGTLSSVVGAFNWLLRNHTQYRIGVVNLAWGAPQATSYHKDILSALVESVWFSGIAVVAAAGNEGPTAGTVTAPASDPFVIAAGSFNDKGTMELGDDVQSGFSSRGPTLDGFTKPDVLAPGDHILSLRAPGVIYRSADGTPIGSPTDRYIHMTGTSSSAAFVSGVAALVASAHEEFGPTQIKGAIVASGRTLSGSATKAVDAPNALVRMTTVNAGLAPSRLLLALLTKSGQLKVKGVTWEGVTWESVSWETITWESVTWESVTWEGVTWEKVKTKKVHAK